MIILLLFGVCFYHFERTNTLHNWHLPCWYLYYACVNKLQGINIYVQCIFKLHTQLCPLFLQLLRADIHLRMDIYAYIYTVWLVFVACLQTQIPTKNHIPIDAAKFCCGSCWYTTPVRTLG